MAASGTFRLNGGSSTVKTAKRLPSGARTRIRAPDLGISFQPPPTPDSVATRKLLTALAYYCINSFSTVSWGIDIADGTPIYLQICEQIKRAVAVGRLKAEEPLPSVRQLALELTVNPNTVARAYLELEHEGVIYKRQGQGTFVSPHALEASRRERRKVVAGLFEKAITEAAAAGMTMSEMDEVYRQAARNNHREKL
jgi:GntR family transcriptional regulator